MRRLTLSQLERKSKYLCYSSQPYPMYSCIPNANIQHCQFWINNKIMKINDDGGDDDESWKLTFVPFMKLLIITYFSKQTQLIFWTYYIQSDCDYSREMWNEDNGKSDIPRNLIVSRIWSWQEIYKARNTENKPKQIHTAVSRNLIVSAKPPLTLRAILDTLWWSWVKKSFPTSIEMYVGGLIYQEQLVATSFQWAEALQRFCSRSQGVVALVSVSDGKIQITILILRRGALSKWELRLLASFSLPFFLSPLAPAR